MVLDHFRNTSRTSTHFAGRAKGDRRRNRNNNIQEEANLRSMEKYFDRALCLGHYFDAWNLSIWLLHDRESVANVYEIHPTL